jgi:hypothetical protein
VPSHPTFLVENGVLLTFVLAGLEPPSSQSQLISASRVAGTTGMSYHTQPQNTPLGRGYSSGVCLPTVPYIASQAAHNKHNNIFNSLKIALKSFTVISVAF